MDNNYLDEEARRAAKMVGRLFGMFIGAILALMIYTSFQGPPETCVQEVRDSSHN